MAAFVVGAVPSYTTSVDANRLGPCKENILLYGRSASPWDAANHKHLIEEHPERQLSQDEIDEVLTNAKRVEIPQP